MTLRQRLALTRMRLHIRARRVACGFRYAIGRNTTTDGYNLFHEGETLIGYYALEGLSENSVLEAAQERFGDVPELASLVSAACERVASKWSSTGDTQGAAEDWAFEKIMEYAESRGITLTDSWSLTP